MMPSRVEWFGDRVTADVIHATRAGMDAVMAAGVEAAKKRVPVRTSTLQGSIQMRPTVQEGNRLVGRWGSFDVNYAAAVELGSKAHTIRPRRKKALFWPGADHPVKLVHHPGSKAKPYLRPAADEVYPRLPAEIRKRMPNRRGGRG